MKRTICQSLFGAVVLLTGTLMLTSTTQAAPGGVKTYLVTNLEKVKAASEELVKNSARYETLITEQKGDYAKAYKTNTKEIKGLISAMRTNYKDMDSFGYETVEGIVAGVEKMAHYDIYLDAGAPQGPGAEDVAPVVLKLKTGETIDKQGALFTYIIEPILWGGEPRWIVPLDLNGNGKTEARESLPKAEVLSAAAIETDSEIGKLLADAKAWEPTQADLFSAMTTMVPTLSDYFEDWKESRYADTQSGRFYAVSRVSDMKGIMKSCAVMYDEVNSDVAKKDKALAKSIKSGFDGILSFLTKLDAKEKSGKITPAEIDELAVQAKAKTDKLVPQIEQAGKLAQ